MKQNGQKRKEMERNGNKWREPVPFFFPFRSEFLILTIFGKLIFEFACSLGGGVVIARNVLALSAGKN